MPRHCEEVAEKAAKAIWRFRWRRFVVVDPRKDLGQLATVKPKSMVLFAVIQGDSLRDALGHWSLTIRTIARVLPLDNGARNRHVPIVVD